MKFTIILLELLALIAFARGYKNFVESLHLAPIVFPDSTTTTTTTTTAAPTTTQATTTTAKPAYSGLNPIIFPGPSS